MGDLNAKVEREIRPNGIGEMNENGEFFSRLLCCQQPCDKRDTFSTENLSQSTWVSPNGDTEIQIDHIAISKRLRSSLQDVRNKRGADIASDQHLLVAKIQLLSTKRPETKSRKFNVQLF